MTVFKRIGIVLLCAVLLVIGAVTGAGELFAYGIARLLQASSGTSD